MKSCQYVPLFAGGERPHLETSMSVMRLYRYYRLCAARAKLVTVLDAILQKRFDSETIFFTTRRGQGMSMCLAQTLLREVMRKPGQKVYTNFELPKAASETIGKYATIERIPLSQNRPK